MSLRESLHKLHMGVVFPSELDPKHFDVKVVSHGLLFDRCKIIPKTYEARKAMIDEHIVIA